MTIGASVHGRRVVQDHRRLVPLSQFAGERERPSGLFRLPRGMLHLGGASAVEDQIGARVQTIGEPAEAPTLDQVLGPSSEGGCVAAGKKIVSEVMSLEVSPTAQATQS